MKIKLPAIQGVRDILQKLEDEVVIAINEVEDSQLDGTLSKQGLITSIWNANGETLCRRVESWRKLEEYTWDSIADAARHDDQELLMKLEGMVRRLRKKHDAWMKELQ